MRGTSSRGGQIPGKAGHRRGCKPATGCEQSFRPSVRHRWLSTYVGHVQRREAAGALEDIDERKRDGIDSIVLEDGESETACR